MLWTGLEIDFGVVVAALQQLFHLFLARLAGVGAGAGVFDGAGGDAGQRVGEGHAGFFQILLGPVKERRDEFAPLQVVFMLFQKWTVSSLMRRTASRIRMPWSAAMPSAS